MTIPTMIKLTGPSQSFSTISRAIGRTAAMRREGRAAVRNLKMQGERGLPRGGPFGLEYLFILTSATLATLSGGAAMSWSRWRRLALCTPRRTWTPMLRPRRKGTVLLLLGALVLPLQAGAQTAAEDELLAEPVRREILAVYDSRE